MSKAARASGARVDLGAVIFPFLLLLTVAAPLGRGLFFAPELDTFTIAVSVLVLILALHLALSGQTDFGRHWLDWAAALFALGYWLGYLVHPVVPYDALQGALRAGMIFSWYVLIAHVVRGRGRLHTYAVTLWGTGVLLAVLGCLAAAGHFPFPSAVSGHQILSTLQYHNALGADLDCTFILGLALCTHAFSGRHRKPGTGRWTLGIYGAGNFVAMLTLLGTGSRGAWLVLPIGLLVWWLGTARSAWGRGAFLVLWPLGLAILLSRPVLDGFWNHHSGAALAALAAGTVLGGLGPTLYRWGSRAWERQRYPIEVRRVLQGVAVLYGGGVLVFLLVSTGRAAASMVGRGLVAGALVTRASSITVQTPSLLQRVVMWHDALRLLPRAFLLGLGGGAWEALYHSVQSAPYWSTEVHDAILQAWLGGGLPAALGLLAAGVGVLVVAWTRRGDSASGALFWGLGVGAFTLFGHSLADFDLSLPALALVIWGAAAAVRGGAGSGEALPGWRWLRGLGGLVAAGALGLGILLPTARVVAAATTAGAAAQAATTRQYASAYDGYQSALQLEPLDARYLADQSQLLLIASAVDHNPATTQQAADTALAALQFGTGNLEVSAVALGVLNAAHHWQQVGQYGADLLQAFPLDPDVDAYVGPALVAAAEGDLGSAAYGSALQALTAASEMPAAMQTSYRTRARGLASHFFPRPALPASAELAVGEADAMLGRWPAAENVLAGLAHGGTVSIADESSGWLAVVQLRAGDSTAAEATLATLAHNPEGRAAYTQAYQWTAFVPELTPGG